MDIHDSVTCEAPWSAVKKLVLESGWSWLDLDEDSVKRPYLTADVLGGVVVGREAMLMHEMPRVSENEIRVHVLVRASEAEHWFPRFHGDLLFVPNGAVTHVSLSGTYEPPFGAAGEVVDSFVGHGIASASLHALLEHVATTLRAAVPFADPPAT